MPNDHTKHTDTIQIQIQIQIRQSTGIQRGNQDAPRLDPRSYSVLFLTFELYKVCLYGYYR